MRGISSPLGSRQARALGAVLLCAGSLLAAPAGAQSPAAPQSRGGFDYWQPDWMVKELWGPGRMPKGMMTRLLRHTTYMSYGVPAEYEGAKSTFAPGPDTTAAGAALYARHCASCHGKDGLGDGDAENALSPSPALLAFMIRRPISVDEYLLWTVSEGGQQFQSQMPAFKDALKRDEIWQLIAYMRAGFPVVGSDGKGPPTKVK
ncbi:MAG: c-type cytochrome [Hyphomicrobiaceae bacterium]|nr:c-type cytochrome [Hyphomicrobiaceae bacterium]